MKLALAALLIGVTSAPAFAGGPATRYRSSGGYAEEKKCYRKEYREEYVPGTSKNPGYVKKYHKRVKVPCERPRFMPQTTPHYNYEEQHPNVGNVDNNSCIEGSILGGIAGGGLGAALSRKDGRLWAIPTGIVGGALLGCQVDGG
jgi:hypothetical protein